MESMRLRIVDGIHEGFSFSISLYEDRMFVDSMRKYKTLEECLDNAVRIIKATQEVNITVPPVTTPLYKTVAGNE